MFLDQTPHGYHDAIGIEARNPHLLAAVIDRTTKRISEKYGTSTVNATIRGHGSSFTLTNMKYQTPSNMFVEAIPMPWGLRTIFYLSVVAMLTGIILPSIVQDDDLTGWAIWVYYPAMIFGTITMAVVSFWFRKLIVWVDDTYLAFGYGKFRKRFTFDQIESVELTPYSFYKYGGAGIRYARDGHRAWSIPFLHTGVEVKLTEGGKDRTYYISSKRAEELEQAVKSRLANS